MSFVNDDMNITNVHRYLQSAKIFHDEDIRLLSQRHCIDNIVQMDTTSPLLPLLDLDFFHEVVSSSDIETSSASCHISTLVAAYCELHQGELSPEEFDKLTDSGHMPVIDKECAMRLLQRAAAAHPITVLPSTSDMNTIKSSTCFQRGCIQAISEHWKEFEGAIDELTVATFPPIVIAELYGRKIENARNEMAVVKKELEVYRQEWSRINRPPILDPFYDRLGNGRNGLLQMQGGNPAVSTRTRCTPHVMPTIGNASIWDDALCKMIALLVLVLGTSLMLK